MKKLFDYETETGKKPCFPRNHLRNMHQARNIISFPFQLVERDDNKPYDLYQDCSALIIAVGGDNHCHEGEQLGKYEEGIVIQCEERDKDNLIKKISSII